MNRSHVAIWGVLCAVLCSLAEPGWSADPQPVDRLLENARKYVESSDKYLHHSKLRRGMKGYGLTVLAGDKIVKFDAEIVSVVGNFNPQQDVILAKLSKQNLEKSMIIAGMSGSPVYMKDPVDGKYKMIGAVAYGWGASMEPLCGIQPITYMLAMPGILPGSSPKAKTPASKKTAKPEKTAKSVKTVFQPATGMAAVPMEIDTRRSMKTIPPGQTVAVFGQVAGDDQPSRWLINGLRVLSVGESNGVRKVTVEMPVGVRQPFATLVTHVDGSLWIAPTQKDEPAGKINPALMHLTKKPRIQKPIPPATKADPAESEPVTQPAKQPVDTPATQSGRPATPDKSATQPADDAVEVEVLLDGKFQVQGLRVGDMESMLARLKKVAKPDQPITIVAGDDVTHARMTEAMEAIRKAGYTKVNLRTTDAPSDGGKSSIPPAAGSSAAARDRDEFLRIVLDPKKGNFSRLYRKLPARQNVQAGRLVSLSLPLSVAGIGANDLESLDKQLAPLGLMPVQGGGTAGGAAVFGGMDEKQLNAIRLEPGSCIAVPLVTGDADWSAIGTVTDVIDKNVLAFGHSFFSEGTVKLPMSTGYVHTIVITRFGSFKLGSTVRQVGTLTRDENVAVGGQIGSKVGMIPMTVHVLQDQDERPQRFHYDLVNEWFFTGLLSGAMVSVSSNALRTPPLYHHVKHDVTIDFSKLGKYRATNITNGYGTYEAASDVARPIYSLLNNPFGPPPEVKRIDVKVSIHEGDIGAQILDVKLDSPLYQPGDTITGTVLVERFRKQRDTLPVSFTLPANLPEGDYALTVGDSYNYISNLIDRQPQLFTPKTVPQLFTALQKIVQPQQDRLYLTLPLQRGGLALGQKTLPELPPSKAKLLTEAQIPDTNTFADAITTDLKTKYVISGSREVSFKVVKRTNETRLR